MRIAQNQFIISCKWDGLNLSLRPYWNIVIYLCRLGDRVQKLGISSCLKMMVIGFKLAIEFVPVTIAIREWVARVVPCRWHFRCFWNFYVILYLTLSRRVYFCSLLVDPPKAGIGYASRYRWQSVKCSIILWNFIWWHMKFIIWVKGQQVGLANVKKWARYQHIPCSTFCIPFHFQHTQRYFLFFWSCGHRTQSASCCFVPRVQALAEWRSNETEGWQLWVFCPIEI